MIIAHLADLHLGYRAYTRNTPDGVNQREADVAAAFADAIDGVAALEPDLIVVAGDLFHSVRPSNAAIAEAFRGFSRLSVRLAGVPIVIVAGDRDTPRSADTASILELFREIPAARVATEALEHFTFPAIDTEVIALPHAALARGAVPRVAPAGGARHRVLVAHGIAVGSLGGGLAGSGADGAALLPEEVLGQDHWDYVALGHHPVAVALAPNVWYAGSVERTSADPWAEAEVHKGFVSFDTAAGTAELHPVRTREVVDLPPVSARGLTPAEVSARMRDAMRAVPGGISGRIVRQVVTDLARPELRELDPVLLREARSSALHFLLDARPPAGRAGDGTATLRGLPLEQQVERYLGEVWSPTQEGVDRRRLVELARQYLGRTVEGADG